MVSRPKAARRAQVATNVGWRGGHCIVRWRIHSKRRNEWRVRAEARAHATVVVVRMAGGSEIRARLAVGLDSIGFGVML